VFINVFIVELKLLRVGCHVMSLFVGCILYADDIILLSPSVTGLQQMLDICSEEVRSISLAFNVNKSHCIVVGKFYNRVIATMMCDNHVQWCNNIKYLGVHLETDKHVRFDIGPCKRAFYSACCITLYSYTVAYCC